MNHNELSTPANREDHVDRRHFLTKVGGIALAAAAAPNLLGGRIVQAAPTPTSAAETVVGKFYQSLSDAQKKEIVLPFDHPLRSRISANWHVTKPKLRDSFYTADQRKMVDEIVKKISTADGYERIKEQTEYDDGGLESYSVAVFGEPGTDKFQWIITGRHLTMRADGDTVDGAAFGGPVIYGHGETDPRENLFHYQTKQVNEVFGALDEKQRKQALLTNAPAEAAVPIQGPNGQFPGLALTEMSSDQKELVEKTLKTLLAPYRQEDVDEVMAILKQSGGLDKLHLAFYQQGDLLNDKVWDIWRVEGPSFVWHFRGAPHVHAYINIGAAKTA